MLYTINVCFIFLAGLHEHACVELYLDFCYEPKKLTKKMWKKTYSHAKKDLFISKKILPFNVNMR